MKMSLPEAKLKDRILLAFGRRLRFRVAGRSMLPAVGDGEIVFIDPKRQPAIGEIALANHPFIQNRKILKRVSQVTADGRFFLLGDNSCESTDSRSFGFVRTQDVIGKAVSSARRTGRGFRRIRS